MKHAHTLRTIFAVVFAVLLVTSPVGPFADLAAAKSSAEPSLSDGVIESNNLNMNTAVETDGTIYVGSDDHSVHAIDAATGDEVWTFSTGSDVTSSPTVVDGTVYVGNIDTVYALDADTGSEEWSYTGTDAFVSSPTIIDGTVYVGNNDNSVYALDAATGTEEWTFATGDTIQSSPTVVDGTVYIGSYDNNLYAIDASTGTEEWNYSTGGVIPSSPTISDGTVYVGSQDNNLHAVDAATGAEEWTFATGDSIYSSPTVVDGTVYIGSFDNSVYAVDAATGTEEWSYATGNNIYQSAPTVVDGTVYIGSTDNSVYAVDAATGSEEWAFATGDSVYSSPTVVDGTVYIGSYDDNLYALDASTGTEEWSYATTGDVYSSPTFVADGESDSSGSRVLLGTLGHHDTLGLSDPSGLSGQVTDQTGSPIDNATVTAYGAKKPTVSEAYEELDSLSDPFPTEWKDQLAADFSLTGSTGKLEEASNPVPLIYPESEWPSGLTTDDPDLTRPRWLDVPADERLVLIATDPAKEGISENEIDEDFLGKTVNKSVVVEKYDGEGDLIDNETYDLTETYNVFSVSRTVYKTHHYRTVQLSEGSYRVYTKGNKDSAYWVKAGDPTPSIDEHLEDDAGDPSAAARAASDRLDDGTLVRVTATTNATGHYSLDISQDVKVVHVQALKAPGVDVDPEDLDRGDVRDVYETDLENNSVYFPSRTKTVEPPKSNVDLRMTELAFPPMGDLRDLEDKISELEDFIREHDFSETVRTITETVTELDRDALEKHMRQLLKLIDSNPALEETYLELSDRETLPNPEDLTDEELKTELALMDKALVSDYESIPSEPPEVTPGENTISARFPFDGDISADGTAVFIDWSDGTTDVVSDEYWHVDNSAVGMDAVVVEDYPIGDADPAAATIRVETASDDGHGRSAATVTNPTFSGDLPTLDSIALTSLEPGPDDTVTVTLNPNPEGSFSSVSAVDIHGPDGETVTASSVNGSSFSFKTAGEGVHHVSMTIEDERGNTYVQSIRVPAGDADRDLPPGIRLQTTSLGAIPIVGDGFTDAKVTESDGELVVSGILNTENTPSDVHVYTHGASGANNEITVNLLSETDGEPTSVRKHVQVAIHTAQLGDEAILYRGEKEPIHPDTPFGERKDVEDGTVIRTVTDADGSVTVRILNDPGRIDKIWYWVRVNAPISLSVAPTPTLPMGTVGPQGVAA